GAWPAHRRLIGGHEAWRPRQTGQAGARIAGAAEIVVRSAVAVDPRLHVFRQFHCLLSFVWSSASHGFSGAADSGFPVTMTVILPVVGSTSTRSPPAALAARTARASSRKRKRLGVRGLKPLTARRRTMTWNLLLAPHRRDDGGEIDSRHRDRVCKARCKSAPANCRI